MERRRRRPAFIASHDTVTRPEPRVTAAELSVWLCGGGAYTCTAQEGVAIREEPNEQCERVGVVGWRGLIGAAERVLPTVKGLHVVYTEYNEGNSFYYRLHDGRGFVPSEFFEAVDEFLLIRLQELEELELQAAAATTTEPALERDGVVSIRMPPGPMAEARMAAERTLAAVVPGWDRDAHVPSSLKGVERPADGWEPFTVNMPMPPRMQHALQQQQRLIPLRERRRRLVAGEDGQDGEQEGGVVPGFWAGALHACDISEAIATRDWALLEHLVDVRCDVLDDARSFRVSFHFSANEYFEQPPDRQFDEPNVLWRIFPIKLMTLPASGVTYYGYRPELGRGSAIKWSANRPELEPEEQARLQKLKLVQGSRKSLFRLFQKPRLKTSGAVEGGVELASEAEREKQARYYAIGRCFRDELCPYAVGYYSGRRPRELEQRQREADEAAAAAGKDFSGDDPAAAESLLVDEAEQDEELLADELESALAEMEVCIASGLAPDAVAAYEKAEQAVLALEEYRWANRSHEDQQQL